VLHLRCALLVPLVAVVAACTWGETAEPTLDNAVGEPATGTSAGCDGPPAEAGTIRTSVGEDEREYLLHTPPAGEDPGPWPLVLNFHGFTSDADSQADYSRLHDAADERGFVVATPEGRGRLAQWNLPPGDDATADVDFALAVVDAVGAERCIDLDRVYATGISNGGAFATVLSCELDDTIAGVAPVAGVNLVEPCPDRRPVAVVAFHGTDDDIVPYDGGAVLFGLVGSEPVEETMAAWADRNGCEAEPSVERVGSEVRRLSWSGCEAPVELFVVEGGGHTWPGAEEVTGLGHVTDEIDASGLVLERFSEA
jgi:polyhydroxybutyrate depolymerase